MENRNPNAQQLEACRNETGRAITGAVAEWRQHHSYDAMKCALEGTTKAQWDAQVDAAEWDFYEKLEEAFNQVKARVTLALHDGEYAR